jgi:hypothetical protein
VLVPLARQLIRPVRTDRPGTMPAGTVLVTTVATLVLALALCAGAIDRKAAGRYPNSEARRGIAGMVDAVTSAFGLDRPEQELSATAGPILGRTPPTGDQRSGDLAGRARAANGADDLTAAIVTGAGAQAPGRQQTVPAGAAGATGDDDTPRLRAPTPERPLRLWVGGDSLSSELGAGLARLAGRSRLFEVVRDSRVSTGLTRPDYFNWPQHLARDVTPVTRSAFDPDIVVLQFGGNDDQAMPAWADEPAAEAGTPAWLDRYRRRVADTMDLLKSPQDDRLVIWLGIPVSKPGAVQHGAALNAIYASEAARRPWVRYFDSHAFLSDAFGRYVTSLANADGRSREMRAADGVHLTVAGGNRLAHAIYARLATLVDLRASPLRPDPAEAAPPSVQERPVHEVVAG